MCLSLPEGYFPTWRPPGDLCLFLPGGCSHPSLNSLLLPSWRQFSSPFGGCFLTWKEFLSLLGGCSSPAWSLFSYLQTVLPTWRQFFSQPGACFPPCLEDVLLPTWRLFPSLPGSCFPPCLEDVFLPASSVSPYLEGVFLPSWRQHSSLSGGSFPPHSREHHCHHSLHPLITQIQPNFPSSPSRQHHIQISHFIYPLHSPF